MSSVETSILGSTVTIRVSGKFDSTNNQDFMNAFKAHPSSNDFIVDLSDADYLDSSALGAMVSLHHYAAEAGKKAMIKGANEMVANVLTISNFTALFTIQ